jgi:hypothetical protein
VSTAPDLSHVCERIGRLVRLAANAGAEEDEARTAAVIACRLMVQHDLIAMPLDLVLQSLPPPVERRFIRTKWATLCSCCGWTVDEGEIIAWAKGQPTWCQDCYRRGGRSPR